MITREKIIGIKSIRRNNMKIRKLLTIVLLILIALNKANAQYADTMDVKRSALILVYADGGAYCWGSQDSVLKLLVINKLKYSDGECVFFKITMRTACPPNFDMNCSCNYFVAYNFIERRFYKLSGFRQSEFKEFYNRELVKEYGLLKSKKETLDNIIAHVFIDDRLDIRKYYNAYCNNPDIALHDTASCYWKSIYSDTKFHLKRGK